MRFLIFILLMAFLNCPAFTAQDDTNVYLYIIDGQVRIYRVKMPNYEDCWETISHGKISSGSLSGKGIKSVGIMFCASKDWEFSYQSTWHK